MSWTFQAVGTAGGVMRAIEESSNNRLTDQSLAEWNEAKPHLLALVGANVGNAVKVNANGHARIEPADKGREEWGPKKLEGHCSIVIEPIYGFVL